MNAYSTVLSQGNLIFFLPLICPGILGKHRKSVHIQYGKRNLVCCSFWGQKTQTNVHGSIIPTNFFLTQSVIIRLHTGHLLYTLICYVGPHWGKTINSQQTQNASVLLRAQLIKPPQTAPFEISLLQTGRKMPKTQKRTNFPLMTSASQEHRGPAPHSQHSSPNTQRDWGWGLTQNSSTEALGLRHSSRSSCLLFVCISSKLQARCV